MHHERSRPLPSRPRRLRPHPARSRSGRAGRRSRCSSSSTTRRAARTHPARRSGLRGLPVRDRRRRGLARPAPHEHGVDLRVRLPRRLLAAVAALHGAARAGHRLCHRARHAAPPGGRRGHARGRLGDREPRPQVDRVQGLLRRPTSAPTSSRRSASTPRSPASVRSASTRAAARRTRRGIVMEEGGFLYSSDSYADDLPYWIEGPRGPHLIVPYTLDANDMRFATAQGFNSGDQFFAYLKDTFDVLYEEGRAGAPKMMSVGLHCRLVGRPGRAAALARFLDYVQSQERVWLCRRIDIARHWHATHPPRPGGSCDDLSGICAGACGGERRGDPAAARRVGAAAAAAARQSADARDVACGGAATWRSASPWCAPICAATAARSSPRRPRTTRPTPSGRWPRTWSR